MKDLALTGRFKLRLVDLTKLFFYAVKMIIIKYPKNINLMILELNSMKEDEDVLYANPLGLGELNKTWICQGCRNSSRKKEFKCNNCGEMKFLYQKGNRYYCNICSYSDGEFFRSCPQCSGNKTMVGDQKKIKRPRDFGDFLDFVDESTVVSESKYCTSCYEKNPLGKIKCWSCGNKGFIDLDSINENRRIGLKKLREYLLYLSCGAAVLVFLFFYDNSRFFNDFNFTLIFLTVLAFCISLSFSAAEAFYRMSHGKRESILRALSYITWFFYAIGAATMYQM